MHKSPLFVFIRLHPRFLRIVLSTALIGFFSGCSHPRQVRRAERLDVTGIKEKAAAFGLVSIVDVDPTILVDLHYATKNNILRRAIYPPEMPCLLNRQTARKLKTAQAFLRGHGCGLRIWDAYRPPEAHLHLWRAHPTGLFVSDPRSGWSKHCYGRAVDVTLVDLEGRELPMPSKFDDFSNKAYFVYSGTHSKIGDRLRLLQRAMKAAGFSFLDTEWWHFNDALLGEQMPGEPIAGYSLGLSLP